MQKNGKIFRNCYESISKFDLLSNDALIIIYWIILNVSNQF